MPVIYVLRNRHAGVRPQRGFSAIELLVVMAIALVAGAVAIPGFASMNRYLRLAGDARDLNGAIALAKMRAAQDYTHARVNIDLANNTFQVQYWRKTGPTTGCWKPNSDNLNTCTVTANSVQQLSQGVTFGFGTATTPPVATQAALAQPLGCSVLAAGITGNSTAAGTNCIEFNSRGLPVDPTLASATSQDAVYITDGTMTYGVTVNQGGLIQDWSIPNSSTTWKSR